MVGQIFANNASPAMSDCAAWKRLIDREDAKDAKDCP
jgi:hypothetical protein